MISLRHKWSVKSFGAFPNLELLSAGDGLRQSPTPARSRAAPPAGELSLDIQENFPTEGLSSPGAICSGCGGVTIPGSLQRTCGGGTWGHGSVLARGGWTGGPPRTVPAWKLPDSLLQQQEPELRGAASPGAAQPRAGLERRGGLTS